MSLHDPGHLYNLSGEQQQKLRQFWALLLSELSAPDADLAKYAEHPLPKEAEAGEVSREKLLAEFVYALASRHTDVLVLRFLRARKWDVGKAVTMFMNALKWREKFDVRGLLEAGEEFVGLYPFKKGKSYFLPNVDSQGRIVHAVHVSRHLGTDPFDETSKFTVWDMEAGNQLLKDPSETAVLLFDMTDFGLKNMDYKFTYFLIACLEAYYPESLGLLLFINAPWIFNGIWKVIRPLLDPVVASKIQFCSTAELTKFVGKECLPDTLGGTYHYDYIPPSAEELEKNKKRAADKAGRAAAEKEWMAAFDGFRAATREWIAAGDKTAAEAAHKKREEAIKTLGAKFETVHTYLYLPGIYNRNGMLRKY